MKRFWDKVQKTDTCWNWIAGTRGKTGYGSLKYEGKVIDAHRFSWYLQYNKFPTQWVLHKCDNRLCVNPSHLFEGSYADNIRDMMEKGRHYVVPHGNRSKYTRGCRCDLCREAQMEHQRQYRKMKRTRSSEAEPTAFNR